MLLKIYGASVAITVVLVLIYKVLSIIVYEPTERENKLNMTIHFIFCAIPIVHYIFILALSVTIVRLIIRLGEK